MTEATTFRHVRLEGITKDHYRWYVAVRFVLGGWGDEYRVEKTSKAQDELAVMVLLPDFLLLHGMVLYDEEKT